MQIFVKTLTSDGHLEVEPATRSKMKTKIQDKEAFRPTSSA